MSHTPTPLRIGQASILSLAALVAATGGLLAASPSPGPGASAGPACFTATPGTAGTIAHPTDPYAVVLRMTVGGGFVPVEHALVDGPTFTLYGNDVAVFRPQPPDGVYPMPGEPWTPYVCATMSPEQVDALLRFALGPGGLQDANESYMNPLVMDVPTTTFDIDAGGVKKTVAVHALGFDDAGVPDQAARAKFAQLADLLDSFEEQVAAGNVETAQLYQPQAYRGILTQAWEGQPGVVTPWPWTDVSVDDFQGPADGVARYAPLTPDQVAAVTAIPSGGHTNILVEDESGTRWNLSVRPLLPDEEAVPAAFG